MHDSFVLPSACRCLPNDDDGSADAGLCILPSDGCVQMDGWMDVEIQLVLVLLLLAATHHYSMHHTRLCVARENVATS